MSATNLMDSLFDLFIFIRADPINPLLFQLLLKYQSWLHEETKINDRSIKKLLNELNLVEDHQYKMNIISKLKRIRLYDRVQNIDRVYQSIGPIKYILESLINVIDQKDSEKIRIMASSVHNYPSFILGKCNCNSIDFWNDHISYYNRIFQSDFMIEWKYLFFDYYPKHEQ